MSASAEASRLRLKATTIGHADHVFLSPLSPAKADWLIELLDPAHGARILDIGCGKAGFLRRLLLQRPGATGVGLDINAAFLAVATSQAAKENLSERLLLLEEPAADYLRDADLFDVVLCFGASQALDGLDALAAGARRALRPGGRLLVGEGFWRQTPAAEYLAVLAARSDELTDHAGNAARLRAAGFEILATATAGGDEWDAYEGLYCRAKTRWAMDHGADGDAARILADAQDWHQAYLCWGRDTLGFGWYLAAAS